MHRWACVMTIAGLVFCCPAARADAQDVEGAAFDRSPVQLDQNVATTVRDVTPMDLLTLRDPHGLSISPDGKQVAFVVGQAEYETNGYRSGLFVVGSQPGSPVRDLGTAGMPHWDDINQWIDEAPQWSPDSRRVSYRMRMKATDDWQVSIWNLATNRIENVIQIPGNVESYRWCPGGRALFLTSVKPRSSSNAAVAGESGILFNPALHPYQVIPAQTQMEDALEPEHAYWIYDFKTRQRRAATQDEIVRWGTWKPPATPEPNPLLAKYHIMDSLASPNGSNVAYLYAVDAPAQSKTWAGRLLVTSDHNRQIVDMMPDAHRIGEYWWNADGSTLYFTEHPGRGRSAELWAFRMGSAGAQLIYRGHGGEFASSFSSDDKGNTFACLRENNVTPPQIAVIDGATKEIRTVVDLNPGFSLLRKGTAERLEGKNSFGDSWFAYLVKPLDFVEGKAYPLIVTTYRSGDYFLRGASGDESPIQVYAAHGFGVLSVDVGWIRNLDPKDFDGKLLDWASPAASIEEAVQGLVRHGIADPARIGISGFSHGEEIAGYALIHSKMFRAAVGAQNYDPFFYYLGSDDWHEIFQGWRLGGWSSGEVSPAWQKIAMSMNAEKIVTPILENGSDTEYLIYLSTYRSLRDIGKPIELYIYPNELHVRNQPKHRLEIYQRNLDWFRFWLKDEQDADASKTKQYRRWRLLRDEAEQARVGSGQ